MPKLKPRIFQTALNGLINPDAGSITMRGRVGALIALGAGFNPILTKSGTEGLGSPQDEQPKVGPQGAAPQGSRKSKYLHQWLRARAHENEPERRAARRKSAAGRPAGLRGSGEPRTKSTPRSTRLSTLPRFGNSSTCSCRVIPRE